LVKAEGRRQRAEGKKAEGRRQRAEGKKAEGRRAEGKKISFKSS